MPKFDKAEKVTFLLRQDLAEAIPPADPDRQKWLNAAVEARLKYYTALRTEARAKAARENGRKGGRPKSLHPQ
jgi:hypothetical protein